jgi:hypothetical protein
MQTEKEHHREHHYENDNIMAILYRDFVTKEDFKEFRNGTKEQFDKIEVKFTELNKKLDHNFYKLCALLITLIEIIPNWPYIKAWFLK